MADHTITLTAEQENALPLRSTDDGDGNRTFETIAEFCCRTVCAVADQAVKQKRQREFDALTEEQKDAAIVAAKSK
jgi:hypothetical protein